MHRKPAIWMLAVILVVASLTITCGKKGEEKVEGTTPIAELIKAGKPPVVMGSMNRGISPIAPTFTVSLTNVSDCPIKSVSGTVVFFDKDGKFLPDSKTDSGYAELTTIKPGERIELQTMTQDQNAVSGRWIIKQVIYMKMNPLDRMFGELPYKWTNPNYEAELASATGK